MSDTDVSEIKRALSVLDDRVRDLQLSMAGLRGERRIQWGVMAAVGLAVLGLAVKALAW